MKRMRVDGVEPQQAAAQFAQQLFRGWGVGDSRCGNGAVLLLATEDRQVSVTTALRPGPAKIYQASALSMTCSLTKHTSAGNSPSY